MEIRKYEYDPNFAIRGLHYDVQRVGVILMFFYSLARSGIKCILGAFLCCMHELIWNYILWGCRTKLSKTLLDEVFFRRLYIGRAWMHLASGQYYLCPNSQFRCFEEKLVVIFFFFLQTGHFLNGLHSALISKQTFQKHTVFLCVWWLNVDRIHSDTWNFH